MKKRKIKYKGKRTDYKVDIYGNVWSYKNKDKPFKLKTITNTYGYKVVNLYIDGKLKQCRVNRLVAEAFLDNPNNYTQVNHKDGNKSNNSLENLEWCTPKYNTRHAIKNGLRIQRGEKYHSSKLSNNDVHKICQLLEQNKLKAKDIPNKIGKHCTLKMIHNILYNNSWSQISSQYNLKKHTIDEMHGPSKLTKSQVKKICKLLETTTLSYKDIATKVGNCTHYDVNHIKNGYTWKSISNSYDFSHRNKK